MKIAKLILHYNTPDLTAKLCKMVPDAIVIDNGSGIPFKISGNKIIRFDDNLGFTRGWNKAIEILIKSPDYGAFWLMNSDIIINQDSVKRVEYVMSNYNVPILTPSYNCFLSSCHNQGTNDLRKVKYIEFTAPVIRRDVFETIGMFDERFSLGYSVETDYLLRMLDAGYQFYCDDGSSFHHIGHQTINSNGKFSDYESRAIQERDKGMTELYGKNWMHITWKKLRMFKPSGISICKLILHYNTPEETASLLKMVPDAIVINNGSLDVFPMEVRFNDNLGFVKNWNRAIVHMRKMDPDIGAFWLMNSDIEISEESIDRIQKLMDSGLYPILTPSFDCWMHQCRNQGQNQIREVKCIEFTAPIIRCDVFNRIGYFDERFNLGSGVDFDFCLRSAKAGIKIFCDDGSSINHLKHRSILVAGTVHDYSARANDELNRGMKNKYGINWKQIIQKKLEINKKPVNMKKVAVYTTIFGGYDHLLPVIRQNHQADFFCITDSPPEVIQSTADHDQWNIIQVNQPRKDLHPRMRAKWYKIFPWEIDELRNYEVVIFVDGCVLIQSPHFISFCLANLKSDIAVFQHPERNCIYDEVKASDIMVKYQDESIHQQAEYYRKFFPSNAGLYACTVIVRKNTERIRALMDSWMHENLKFTWQDQLSFPVVCRVHKIIPDILPGNLYDNPYFKRIGHINKQDQALIDSRVKTAVIEMPSRVEVMNFIIEKMEYKSFLEVGHEYGITFDKIKCELKESVDPFSKPGHNPTHLMESDRFFAENKRIWDMIYIDGDHNINQVWRDFEHAYNATPEHGCIVMHDTNPPNERYTQEDRCGTAYHALVFMMYTDLKPIELYTLSIPDDQGNGISIIFKGKHNRPSIKAKNLTEITAAKQYDNFDKNRKEIANLITFDELASIVYDKSKPIETNSPKKNAKKIRK